MHQEKAAVQQKLARIEQAEAHKVEIRAVKEAASELDEKALAYYYIKAIETMSQGKGTKIFFPAEFTKLAGALTGLSTDTSPKERKVIKKTQTKYQKVLKEYINKSVKKSKTKKKAKKSAKSSKTKKTSKKTKKKNVKKKKK